MESSSQSVGGWRAALSLRHPPAAHAVFYGAIRPLLLGGGWRAIARQPTDRLTPPAPTPRSLPIERPNRPCRVPLHYYRTACRVQKQHTQTAGVRRAAAAAAVAAAAPRDVFTCRESRRRADKSGPRAIDRRAASGPLLPAAAKWVTGLAAISLT